MQSKPALLDAEQVAERLNVSPRLAHRLMLEMNPIDVGAGDKHKFWRVKPSELDAWVERRVQVAESTPPTLTLIKNTRRPKPIPGMIQPINGRIPNRRELREAQGSVMPVDVRR